MEPYAWQLDVPGFGEEGQRRLMASTVLVSRVGGVGGAVAQALAMAGVGRLILAHAGDLRLDDLNRQGLMSHDGIGSPRAPMAAARLSELNPRIVVEAVEENITEENVERLVGRADLVVSCAPLFKERLLMNRAAVKLDRLLVDCAMWGMEGQVLAVLPGRTLCLRCLYPEEPAAWTRRFPVFGAVAQAVGSIGATEAIKLLAGFGEPLAGRLLLCDFAEMSFRRVNLDRMAACPDCGSQEQQR